MLFLDKVEIYCKIKMINNLQNWNWIIFSTLMCEQVFNGSYGSEEENRLEENLDQVGIENKKFILIIK